MATSATTGAGDAAGTAIAAAMDTAVLTDTVAATQGAVTPVPTTARTPMVFVAEPERGPIAGPLAGSAVPIRAAFVAVRAAASKRARPPAIRCTPPG